MKRKASEVIRNLEMRIAQLEKMQRVASSPSVADQTSAGMYRKVIRSLKLDRNPLTNLGFSVTKGNSLIDGLKTILINASSVTGTVRMLSYANRKVSSHEVRTGSDVLGLLNDPNLRLHGGTMKMTILGMMFSLDLNNKHRLKAIL